MSQAWVEIFKAAIVSPMGIAGLAILVAGSVVITLFGPQDKPGTKLLAVTILLLFCGVLACFALYTVQPTVVAPQTEEAAKKNPGAMKQPFSPGQRSLALSSSLDPNSGARGEAANKAPQVPTQPASTSERSLAEEASAQHRLLRADVAKATKAGVQLELVQAAEPPGSPSLPAGAAQVPVRIDCGTAWTGWIDAGDVVRDPCPTQCTRGAELARSFRVVGFPPHTQANYQFQCWRK